MLALPMPKSLKKLLLNHIDIEIPPDSTISIREEDLKAHRAVLVHWSGHCDADLEGNEEDGYRIDLADVVEPGTMRDVLGVMYGLPFGEHRGEDWDVVLSHFHNACYHLDISDIDDHTYWVLLSSSIGEDAEEPLPDDDVPTDEDYDDLALMTNDDSDTHTMLPLHDAQDTQGHRGRKLLIDSDSDVTMETAHE